MLRRILRWKLLKFFIFSIFIAIISFLVSGISKPQQNLSHAQTSSGPTLDTLELVTSNAKTSNVPNGWGTHKTRIIRLSTGELFTVYVDESLQFHVMKKAGQGGWTEVLTGSTISEPINIVKGPQDDVHVFSRTSGIGEYVSTDKGQTFQFHDIQGNWAGGGQGYAGAGANALGDFAAGVSGGDVPGELSFGYFSHLTKQWTVHTIQFDLRCTYAYYFPGTKGDLTITCMRDVHPSEAGYNLSGVDYIFNQVEYFYIPNVDSGESPQFSQLKVATADPQGNLNQFADVMNEPDSYIDINGIDHIIYYNQYDGVHEALIQNNSVLKDVILPLVNTNTTDNQVRIVQDTTGHFYVIQMNNNGQLEIYPGAADDTDGTKLTGVITLDNSQFPGCGWQNDDTCHSPMFAVPRNGTALADYIDGVYGVHNQEVYFHITLRKGSPVSPTSATSPVQTLTPTGSGPTTTISGTAVAVTLCPHGIGNCGDNANPQSKGNTSPQITSRQVTLSAFDINNTPVVSGQGTVTFDASSGTFKGSVPLAISSSGQYVLKITMPRFLTKQIGSSVIQLTAGQTNTVPQVALIAGDINGDNKLDILDYNILISCYGSKATTSSCIDKQAADITDDGIVDGFDYNLFLRELSVQTGQ